MINWNFNSNDYQEQSFKPIPVGDYRVRISHVETGETSTGKQMIKMTLDVSGHNGKIFHNLVLNPENQKLTNQKLGELFDSFGIQQGNFNLSTWIGKVGAAKVKHEEYNGNTNAKINYFIAKYKQDKMPAWVEPSNIASVTGQAQAVTPASITEDVPW